MIDLHTHSILSDGALLPFELVRRAAAAGYRALAVTDHVDASNIDSVVPALVRAIEQLRPHCPIDVIAGAEITHAPPALVEGLVGRARQLGAALVLVHGETLAEPVEPGTNRAGIDSGADILAHPGLITEEDALLAREKGVALEISARKGHSLANGHVARAALRHGAALVINTDAHEPSDLITAEAARRVLAGAGLDGEMVEKVLGTCKKIADRTLGRSNA